MEDHFAVVYDVGSHTGKGNGQVVGKVERVAKTRAELVEELSQVLALDDAAGVQVALADGHARCNNIGVLLFAVADALVAQVLLVGDDVAPVLHPHHRVERMGIVAYGVEATYDAAHRCAGDVVDGDACLLQHFQHTDVCHALCAAAA